MEKGVGQKPGERERSGERSQKTMECVQSEEQRVIEREWSEERAQLSAQNLLKPTFKTSN